MRIIIYRTSGAVEVVRRDAFPELHELQKIVGGNIELVHMKDGTELYVNETGLIDSLPANPFLWLADGSGEEQMGIFGDAVHFMGGDGEGNSLGFPDDGPLPLREFAKAIVWQNGNAAGGRGDEYVRAAEGKRPDPVTGSVKCGGVEVTFSVKVTTDADEERAVQIARMLRAEIIDAGIEAMRWAPPGVKVRAEVGTDMEAREVDDAGL